MKKPKRQIIAGTDLLGALTKMRPDHVIKMMVDEKVCHISVAMALFIVRASSYEGEYRHGRIFKIRGVDHRRSNAHRHEFRDGRSCLQFVPITHKTVHIWDKSNRITPVTP